MLPGRTTTLHTDTSPDDIAARLREAVRGAVFVGDVGADRFRLFGAGKAGSRPNTTTSPVILGRWSPTDSGRVKVSVTYVPPLVDFLLLVFSVVVLGPVAVEAWASPDAELLMRVGSLAALLVAVVGILGVSWLRMRKLRQTLRSTIG